MGPIRGIGWAALAFIAACVSMNGGAEAACSLGAVAVLPMENAHGSPVFQADIDGHPANLLFDTGAFAVMLNRPAASRLGVRLSEMDRIGYGVGGVQHIWRGTVQRMRVGNISASGVTVGGSDLTFLDNTPLDGLFGMNLIAAYDIDLDLVGQHVLIFEPDGNCRTPTVALAQPLYDVPLVDIDHDRQADVDITINGQHVRAVIDSGASHTAMFRSSALRLGVDLSGFSGPDHHMSHGIGPLPVRAFNHRFERVRIGTLEIDNMPIEIIDQARMGINRVHIGSLLEDLSDGEAGGEDMLLGADFMRKVHLWISHSSHRLIMQYPPQPSVLPH